MSEQKRFLKTNIDSKISKKPEELLQLPKTIFVNKFNEESAKKFIEDFYEAEDTGQSIIPIYIDSYGGYVYSLISMIDVIKSSKVPVATIALGKAMSCGALLLSQGTEGYRFMGSYSRIMIHEISAGTIGKVEEIKADCAETDKLNKLAFKLMSNNTGHEDDYFMKIIHEKNHADWYLTSEEAKNHNLVNHIRIPKFSLDVKAELSFG